MCVHLLETLGGIDYRAYGSLGCANIFNYIFGKSRLMLRKLRTVFALWLYRNQSSQMHVLCYSKNPPQAAVGFKLL